jgi:hypothetical protein
MKSLLRSRALLLTSVFCSNDFINAQAVVASAAGTVAGQIAAATKVALCTSANDLHYVTLPAVPVPGTMIRIMNIDDAQNLVVQPYTATHKINNVACGGIGATGVGLTLGEKTGADFYCISATEWLAINFNATLAITIPA